MHSARRPRRPHSRRRRLAPNRRTTQCSPKHHPDAAATLCSGTQPSGKRLGIPQAKSLEQPRLGDLRGYHRGVLQRLEHLDRNARSNNLDRRPRLGTCVMNYGDWYYLGTVDREGALEDEHGRPADDDTLAATLPEEDTAAA